MYRFFLLLFIIVYLASCQKTDLTCDRHCVPLLISGRVYDATSNKGFAGAPVMAKWEASFTMGGLSPTPKTVRSSHTDDKGHFSFHIEVDSTLFSRNHLTVQVAVAGEYIQDNHDGGQQHMFEYEPEAFQLMDFAFYPRTNLTIRLHRKQNDQFLYYSVEHYFNKLTYNDFLIDKSSLANDTVIHTETAANTYTKVKSAKVIAFGLSEEKIDSIRCIPGSINNVLDIDY